MYVYPVREIEYVVPFPPTSEPQLQSVCDPYIPLGGSAHVESANIVAKLEQRLLFLRLLVPEVFLDLRLFLRLVVMVITGHVSHLSYRGRQKQSAL